MSKNINPFELFSARQRAGPFPPPIIINNESLRTMIMNKIIEKLKDMKHVRAFYMMPLEEQEVLLKAGWENRIVLAADGWRNDCDKIPGRSRCHLTYAIKPDYQPEPEFVDLEIKVYDGKLVVEWGQHAPIYPSSGICPDFTVINCLPSLPNFHCFWHEFQGGKVEFYTDGKVSKLRDEGKIVYARFRKP